MLSPFLWNLVIEDLLQYTAKHIPGYIQAFTDDIMSLAEGDDLDVISQRTQTTIKTIENWCQSKGLNISALKTKIVMFTLHMEQEMVPAPHRGLRGDNRTQQRSQTSRYHTRQQANIQHSYRQHNRKNALALSSNAKEP